jgi:hypothetical protein
MFIRPLLILTTLALLVSLPDATRGQDAKSKERVSATIAVKATDEKTKTLFEVQQGEWIELEIKGKWRMWDQWEYTGALGHTEFKKINNLGTLGALVVQIGDGKPFTLADQFPFQAPDSGAVQFWPNRGGYTNLKADGELTIVVHTGDKLKEKKSKVLAAAKEARDMLLADPQIRQALAGVNAARKTCGLDEVGISVALSLGCRKHAKYLVVNRGNPLVSGLKAHEEHKELKEFSEEGAKAGKHSVIAYGPPTQAIGEWLSSFYHRVPLLQPDLKEIGIGAFQQGDRWASCIDCVSGCTGPITKSVVYYPEDGQQNVPLRLGPEIPRPLPASHQGPAGFPNTIFFTQQQKVTKVEAKMLGPSGARVECYVSTPEAPATDFTQWNTVCVIPRQPLLKNTTYKAELRCMVDGKELARTWQFTTQK